MYKTKIILSSFVAITLFNGCVTTNLESTATMTQTIFIDPVAKEKKIIFLNSKNTSGQNVNLENKLRTLLQAKGYIITDNPELATFILNTNVLYCDKKRENNAGVGASLGAGTGLGVAAYNSNSITSSILTTGAIALAGGLIGKITEDTIYQIQVDINIKQKSKNKVLSTTSTNQGQANVIDGKRAGFANSLVGAIRGDKTGNIASNISNSSSQAYSGEYIEKATMMFAEATKMNLKINEAIPVLEDKIANQIAGLF